MITTAKKLAIFNLLKKWLKERGSTTSYKSAIRYGNKYGLRIINKALNHSNCTRVSNFLNLCESFKKNK